MILFISFSIECVLWHDRAYSPRAHIKSNTFHEFKEDYEAFSKEIE